MAPKKRKPLIIEETLNSIRESAKDVEPISTAKPIVAETIPTETQAAVEITNKEQVTETEIFESSATDTINELNEKLQESLDRYTSLLEERDSMSNTIENQLAKISELEHKIGMIEDEHTVELMDKEYQINILKSQVENLESCKNVNQINKPVQPSMPKRPTACRNSSVQANKYSNDPLKREGYDSWN